MFYKLPFLFKSSFHCSILEPHIDHRLTLPLDSWNTLLGGQVLSLCKTVPFFMLYNVWYHDLLHIKVAATPTECFSRPLTPPPTFPDPFFRHSMNTDNAMDMILPLPSSFCWKSMWCDAWHTSKCWSEGKGGWKWGWGVACGKPGGKCRVASFSHWVVVYVCVTHHAAAKLQISLRWYFATFTNVLVPPMCVCVCISEMCPASVSVRVSVSLRLWLAFQAYLTFMLDVSVAANIRMYVLVPWESIETMGGGGWKSQGKGENMGVWGRSGKCTGSRVMLRLRLVMPFCQH